MRKLAGLMSKVVLLLVAIVALPGMAADQVLFKNVNIFDGTSEKLAMGMDVLVDGNLIGKIGKGLSAGEGATVIDGKGRTLMPGMIENHAHLMLMGPSLPAMEGTSTWEDFAIHGTKMAQMYLNQGFTTLRDAGGGNGGLQRAINSGMIPGPRYYPSAAFIGGRGGHADFANYTAPIGQSSNMSRLNMAVEADGRDAVLKVARNNFRMGASQLKVMQSGGVVSAFDPWQMDGRTTDEISAAVEIAEQYGSYVMAHSYKRESMVAALEAGVKSLEHGFMYDCEIGKLMEKKGAYITTNLTAFIPGLMDIPAVKNVPASLRKAKSAQIAFEEYLDNMRQCPAKRGFHTDCVGSVEECNKQIHHEQFLNGDFFDNHTALVAMTSVGGEIAAMTGDFMNPYPDGKLGVIEEGAYADILLIDGNPLEDLSVIGAHPKWFDAPTPPDSPEGVVLIMKDGVIHKNTL